MKTIKKIKEQIMKYLLLLLIPAIYGVFNWPRIKKKRPIQVIKEDIEDQNNFSLTEIPNSNQISEETTQNETIINDISIYNNKKTVL